MEIQLRAEYVKSIEELVAAGVFSSIDEALHEAVQLLRLVEQRKALRAMDIGAEESGSDTDDL